VIKVAVVDDGSVAIRGAVEVLRGSSRYAFLGAYPAIGAVPADSFAAAASPVIVVDPFVGSDRLDALSIVAGGAAVLIMSGGTRPELVRQALQAGARGFIAKQTVVSTLLAAVSAVGVGGIYLDGCLNDVLTQQLDGRPGSTAISLGELTPRERDVLVMVAQGLTHKQIGTRLHLSKATIDTYVHRVRQKVGSVNKAGLTRVAIDLKLLPD
jgi:DNA-binding NarL/FixJ family response regulator